MEKINNEQEMENLKSEVLNAIQDFSNDCEVSEDEVLKALNQKRTLCFLQLPGHRWCRIVRDNL